MRPPLRVVCRRWAAKGPAKHDRRALDEYLLNDADAPYADRPQNGDLAESLVHGDRDERRDEQKTHRQTDGAEDECELPEVAEALFHLLDGRRRRDRTDGRQLALDRLTSGLDVASIAKADHDQIYAIDARRSLHRLQRAEWQRHRPL